jgi:hypothetical protein
MPALELTGDELIIHLKLWERLAALRTSIRIPLENVRGATNDDGFGGSALGLRMFGTGVPGLIWAGVFRKGGDQQFAFLTKGARPVVIELADEKWARIILGAADPRSMANRINSAVQEHLRRRQRS